MCDVDFFKKYNDNYGHQEGDKCLQTIADAMRNNVLRPTDCVARYGGEEFIVLLPDTTAEQAVTVAERMRVFVEQLTIPHVQSPKYQIVTLSIGVAGIVPNINITREQLIQMADNALYSAKEKGRNQTVLYTDATEKED